MPRYGFVGDMPDTKNLVLFVMRHVNSFVTMEDLSQMVMLDDNFDYFVFADAVSDMVGSGLLKRDAEGRVAITARGAEAGKAVESALASSLRRVASKAAEQVAERLLRDSAITADTFTLYGEQYLRCVITDGVAPLADLTLYAGSAQQAALLAKKWRKNAEGIYQRLLESFIEGGDKPW